MPDERSSRHPRLAFARRMSVLAGGLSGPLNLQDEAMPTSTRPTLTSITVRRHGRRLTAQASLVLDGKVLTSGSTRADGSRALVVAQATLSALAPLLGRDCLVESAELQQAGHRQVALVVVTFPEGETDHWWARH